MVQINQSRQVQIVAFFIVVLFLLLAGSAQAAKNHLVVGFEDTVGTMNYYQTTARVDMQAAMMIYDRIFSRHTALHGEWT